MARQLSYKRDRISHNKTYRKVNSPGNGVIARINNKINNLSRIQFNILVLIFLCLICGIVYSTPAGHGAVNTLSTMVPGGKDSCSEILNPSCWTDNFFPKLPEKDGYTNALLIGIDSRGVKGQDLMNTDTIIVASYNHKDGKTTMISFPRDMYVPYTIDEKGPYYTKINQIYATGQIRNEDGMGLIKSNIEDWLGLEIHYTAIVNFKTVTEVVDAVGGIEVEVEEKYTDIYPYKELSTEYQKNCKRAVDYPQYCVFSYEPGIHKFNGEEALIYSRMRYYSSDFNRARKQQQVIDAIKTKVIGDGSNLLEKAKFAWDIYNTVTKSTNVKSNVQYKDLMAGLRIVSEADLNPASIVLDPEFGGGGYMFPDSVNGMYVVQIKGKNFDLINEYLGKIKKNPAIYDEKVSLILVNKTGEKEVDEFTEIIDSDLPFELLKSVSQTKEESADKTVIYVFDDEVIETIKYLQGIFPDAVIKYDPENYDIKKFTTGDDIMVIKYAELTVTPTPSA